MKGYKKGLALLLTAAMSTSMLFGCGSTSSNSSSESVAGSESAQGSESASSEEVYKVTMAYIGDEFPDSEAAVLEKINERLRADLNMELDLVALPWGTYTNELSLMLSGDEALDIVPIVITNAAGYVSNGQVLDLTDYIDKYGTNIKKVMQPDFLTTPNIGGFTYGVTSMREQITQESIIMRTDLLEEAGFSESDIKSMDDLDKVYAAVYAKHPEMTMLGSAQNSTPLFRWETFDALTDGFGVLMDKGESTEVVNLYETEEFKAFAQKMYDWNQASYISKDAATTTETLINQVKAGTTFSYFTPNKAGAVEQDELNTGHDLTLCSLFGDPYITSYSVNFFTWGIARNSKNPEKAFQCLDYIYGSPEVMNLLNWGIEGEHYQFADKEKGIITYPEGVDASNKKYGLNIGWELPNQTIAYVWEGEDPSKWEVQNKLIDSASRSKALGFAYDSSSVSNELTALTNAKNQWYDAIGSGSLDPAESIPQFNKALYDAGLQTVIDLKQKQLDEWMKTKK